MMIKEFIKSLIPPIFTYLLKDFKQTGWHGNYKTWQKASSKSTGYNSTQIVEKVKNSLLKVINNEAEFERDSYLFYQPDYNYPLLSSLIYVAIQKDKVLKIADFGGSLGSTYFQYKKLLSPLVKIKWNIIEQHTFVETGKKFFETEDLKFYSDFDKCFSNAKIDVVLFSSVFQYLEDPFKILTDIIKSTPEFILVDRTGFINQQKHRLTVQVVPKYIYEASYPCWFFNENEFLKSFQDNYKIIFQFMNNDYTNLRNSYFKGFLFQKK